MRGIKFRALRDDKSCEFVYGNLIYNGDIPRIQQDNNSELFVTCLKGTEGEYTGLKDKNGKEIYEGDILILDEIIVPITWDDGGFQMITNNNQGKSAMIQNRVKRFEVIGNIHENPELLK